MHTEWASCLAAEDTPGQTNQRDHAHVVQQEPLEIYQALLGSSLAPISL